MKVTGGKIRTPPDKYGAYTEIDLDKGQITLYEGNYSWYHIAWYNIKDWFKQIKRSAR